MHRPGVSPCICGLQHTGGEHRCHRASRLLQGSARSVYPYPPLLPPCVHHARQPIGLRRMGTVDGPSGPAVLQGGTGEVASREFSSMQLSQEDTRGIMRTHRLWLTGCPVDGVPEDLEAHSSRLDVRAASRPPRRVLVGVRHQFTVSGQRRCLVSQEPMLSDDESGSCLQCPVACESARSEIVAHSKDLCKVDQRHRGQAWRVSHLLALDVLAESGKLWVVWRGDQISDAAEPRTSCHGLHQGRQLSWTEGFQRHQGMDRLSTRDQPSCALAGRTQPGLDPARPRLLGPLPLMPGRQVMWLPEQRSPVRQRHRSHQRSAV